MKLTFIIPCYNASANIIHLATSLFEQKDKDWYAIFIDDKSTDDTRDVLAQLNDERISVVLNDEKCYALKNIVTIAKTIDDGIIAVIDGDDQLCNADAVTLIKDAYVQPGMVVWTAHKWDINGLNVSSDLPPKVNPYQFRWCSSHLRTFDVNLLKSIPESNFKDHYGTWFERGYDQALMLPLLYKATKRKYLSDVCYLYKINSCSMPVRDWTEMKQIRTVNIVRARGFLDK